MKTDDFGNRMKKYENVWRFSLPERLPLIVRIDGCHFHTFTKDMDKPFDQILIDAFWETCQYLAQNIMGCKLVYHQSDEISLLLTNYDSLQAQSWFGNNLQKIVSVAASLATAKFNEIIHLHYTHKPLAAFDARAWVLPHEEVNNYFLWRQQDAAKNSVSMAAYAYFKHKELHGLGNSELQEKLFQEKGINWDKYPTWQKRGACIVNVEYTKGQALRRKWVVDEEIPLFSKDRNYVERFVYLQKDA